MSGATAINDALIRGSIDIGAYGLPGVLIAREKTPGLTKAIVDALGEACGIIAHDPARTAALYLESESSKLTSAQVEAI